MKRRKALCLLSGGLDSILSIRLILDQGIDVEAINFVSPFCPGFCGGDSFARRAASRLGVRLRTIRLGEDYLKVIENPKYGYGKNMNPCIDCRIMMIEKAKEYAAEVQADFLFTGEVLGQRPKSQLSEALALIDRETQMEGKLLRPLSAKLLPETEAERKGWVDREQLLDLEGRSRRRQLELAKSLGLVEYPSPSGGCLLTDPIFSARLRDSLKYEGALSLRSINLLKVGRHFRFGSNKIVVGRNEEENEWLMDWKTPHDHWFEVSDYGSPVTLLLGPENEEGVRLAASITARYSDAPGDSILVKYGRDRLERSIVVSPPSDERLERLRVG